MAEKQYVIFKLDTEEYGVDIMYVKEIGEFKESSKVPHAPEFVEGIINYRGNVTPIINLRKKFNLPAHKVTSDTRIIIINLEEKQVGFLVDDASQVLTIDEKDIDPAPDLLSGVEQKFISGIGKLEDRMIILLNLREVLSDDEKAKLKAI